MQRKTMRINMIRTSVKLEPEYWLYLQRVADREQTAKRQETRLTRHVRHIAASHPQCTNLASVLRVFCITHAVKELELNEIDTEATAAIHQTGEALANEAITAFNLTTKGGER